jgi:hypothetical protein
MRAGCAGPGSRPRDRATIPEHHGSAPGQHGTGRAGASPRGVTGGRDIVCYQGGWSISGLNIGVPGLPGGEQHDQRQTQLPVERLGWCVPAEGLAGSGVQGAGDRFDQVVRVETVVLKTLALPAAS